jgi:glycosyltransferase involved in cell wall biosynthesis
MKNKTLIYSPSFGIWGGGQIYIEQLCLYMNRKGIKTFIVTAEPEAFSCPVREMENVLSRKKRLSSSVDIAKRYRKEGFDTIILNDLASLWLAPVFKLYGYRVISLLHLYLRKKEGEGLGHALPEYYLLKFSAKFCDAILSVNRDNQRTFGKRVAFIGNYVPDWFFDVASHPETKQYDFLMISRFSIEKNIPLFLKLLKAVNEHTQRNYTALLIGEGPEKEHIMQCIEAYGLQTCVDVRAWVERRDLPRYYDLGKCFVISSYHEGFATTLLEAHARGLPAIVTRSSGFCVEYVQGYGEESGVVFEPSDLEDAAFLDRVAALVDDAARYDTLCRKKAAHFSEEKVLGPILDVIREDV